MKPPKVKNAEYEEDSTWQAEAEWQDQTWETEEYEASKGKTGKGKQSKSKGKSKEKSTPTSITPRPAQFDKPKLPDQTDLPKPEARSCVADGFLFAMMTTNSKFAWRHATWNSADYMVCTVDRTAEEAPNFQAWQMVNQCSTSNRFVRP